MEVIIHLVFIASGLLLAAMDYIAANTKNIPIILETMNLTTDQIKSNINLVEEIIK